MNTNFRITTVGEATLAQERQLLRVVEQSFRCSGQVPVPGDLLMLPIERGIPPVVFHVNRRILSVVGDTAIDWEIVLEQGNSGLFAGREYIQGVVEKMVKESSKRVLNEAMQVQLITDTIYEATKGRVIYG